MMRVAILKVDNPTNCPYREKHNCRIGDGKMCLYRGIFRSKDGSTTWDYVFPDWCPLMQVGDEWKEVCK